MVTTSALRRTDQPYTLRRYASSAREKNSGRSSCCTSSTEVTAGRPGLRGSMMESGKCRTSTLSKRRRMRPPAIEASAIASMRPGIEREARYSLTISTGAPVTSVAIGGRKTR
jgi:hypothetical protein